MELLRNKYVLYLIVFVGGIASGIYFTSYSETKTEVTQTDTTKNVDKDKHTETTTTEVVKPDGTKETVTKTVTDTHTEKKTEITKNEEKKDDVSRGGSSKVTVSALAGVSFKAPTEGLIYGASVTKPILGPITVGVWGLTNSTFGGSVGLSF